MNLLGDNMRFGGRGGGLYYKPRGEFILQKNPCATRVAKIVATLIDWSAFYTKLTTCFFSFLFQDNCPFTPNPDQKDSDRDRIGDECDSCPFTENANQEAICLVDRDYDGEYTSKFRIISFGRMIVWTLII